MRIDSDIAAVRPAHYGTGYTSYRRRAGIENGCVVCNEKTLYKIAVHHKDGDRKNGKLDNLEVVCHNCHSTRHLRKIGDNWVYDPNVLTPRDIVDLLDAKIKDGVMV